MTQTPSGRHPLAGIFIQQSTIARAPVPARQKNAAEASHLDRIARGFLFCLRRRSRGGMTASARQRPRSGRARAPHLPKPVAEPQLHQSRTRNRCGGQRPCPCSKEQEGRRPQRPGNQSALTRFSECPPAILSNRRLSLAGPQSVG